MRTIIFYKTQSGKSPITEFLDTLNPKQAKKVTWVLNLVENQTYVPLNTSKAFWNIRIVGISNTIWV